MTLGVGTEDTRGWEWQQAVGVRWGVARPRVSVRSRGGNLQRERRRQVRILESEHDVSMLGEEEAGLREEGIWGGGGGKGDWAPDVDQSGLGKWAEKEGRARVEAQEWILGALKGDPEVRAWGEGGPGEWPQGWAGDPDPLRCTGAAYGQKQPRPCAWSWLVQAAWVTVLSLDHGPWLADYERCWREVQVPPQIISQFCWQAHIWKCWAESTDLGSGWHPVCSEP